MQRRQHGLDLAPVELAASEDFAAEPLDQSLRTGAMIGATLSDRAAVSNEGT
jgi:hypothetical protein